MLRLQFRVVNPESFNKSELNYLISGLIYNHKPNIFHDGNDVKFICNGNSIIFAGVISNKLKANDIYVELEEVHEE